MNFKKQKIHRVTKEPTLFPITVFLDSFYCKMLGTLGILISNKWKQNKTKTKAIHLLRCSFCLLRMNPRHAALIASCLSCQQAAKLAPSSSSYYSHLNCCRKLMDFWRGPEGGLTVSIIQIKRLTLHNSSVAVVASCPGFEISLSEKKKGKKEGRNLKGATRRGNPPVVQTHFPDSFMWFMRSYLSVS